MRIMSFDEVVNLTNLPLADLALFSKISNSKFQSDDDLKLIKVSENDKITQEDIVWPNLRKLINEYKNQIEKLEEKILEKTTLIRHKIRHKVDKKVLLKIMISRKTVEKKRDRLFDFQLQCETILGR